MKVLTEEGFQVLVDRLITQRLKPLGMGTTPGGSGTAVVLSAMGKQEGDVAVMDFDWTRPDAGRRGLQAHMARRGSG
jgi:hypothetical protein